jgi:hypothetical protein
MQKSKSLIHLLLASDIYNPRFSTPRCLSPILSVDNYLLGGVDDVAASDLALVHQVVHLLELGETDNLVRRLDQAAAVELERLCGVPAVAHVRALDGDHLDDGLEYGCAEVGAGGETDAHDCTAWADVLLTSR